jgi:hypothetical protein
MLKLYNFPQSTCSQKVRLTLWEKSLEFIEMSRVTSPAVRIGCTECARDRA